MDTALILAGGESARFGRPKALVDVGGKPMVSRVFDAVQPLAGEVIVAVADAGMAAAMKPTVPLVKFAVDRRRGVGPIEGLARGFSVALGDRVLVAPCDAPLLRAEMYRLLLTDLGDHDVAVPRLDVLDPVRAVYRKTAVLRILAKATEPVPSPSALVDRLDAVFVSEERLRSVDPRLDSFLDVNTHADLDQALRRMKTPAD
ncbi:MAG TPA: molybdenum cofactor guanylyltransferase [Thermoplasmata archaeon]